MPENEKAANSKLLHRTGVQLSVAPRIKRTILKVKRFKSGLSVKREKNAKKNSGSIHNLSILENILKPEDSFYFKKSFFKRTFRHFHSRWQSRVVVTSLPSADVCRHVQNSHSESVVQSSCRVCSGSRTCTADDR